MVGLLESGLHMITVYTQPNCPYCVKAKAYLEALELPFRTVDIRQDDTAMALMREAGHRSVPQLYVGEHLLVEGGFDGLSALSKGEIEERIDQLT